MNRRDYHWLAGGLCAFVGFLIAGMVLCTVAHSAEPMKPFWSGPVYGVFTDAGPDSAQGPRAKIHVPIGVALTKPLLVSGYNVTPETQFQWTTKAYLGEDSDPLKDASYNWMPYVRIAPAVESPTGVQWVKIGVPDHLSNGAEGGESRSMNAASVEVAYAFLLGGIAFDVYAKGWYTYDLGTNTETIGDAINLAGDFGGRVIVRGKVDMLELATELGPEWQKVMAYVPLQEFYNFGLYLDVHHGKAEGLLEYDQDVTTVGGGFAFRPN